MAVEQYLIDTIVDRVLKVLTGAAGPDDSLDREVRWDLQAAQMSIVSRVGPHAFRSAFSITTVDGQSTYDLPDDFHQILEDTVRFEASDFRTLREIPIQMFHRYESTREESEGDPDEYFILDKAKGNGAWRIFFHPTPDTNTRVIVGAYRSLPAAVWNSTRGSEQKIDLRFPIDKIPLLVHGCIATGRFTRYLNPQDLAYHTKSWEEGIMSWKQTNNPVVGKAYSRQPFPARAMRIPGGVQPGWWGGPVTPAT